MTDESQKAPETEPAETAEAVIPYVVSLRCEVPFEPSVFRPAWQTRLPELIPTIDHEKSGAYKTVFDVQKVVMASSSPAAASGAKALLLSHFQTLKVLAVTVEPDKK